jgi:hypothetical protein
MVLHSIALFALLVYIAYLHTKIRNLEEVTDSHAQDLRILDGRTKSTDEYVLELAKRPAWMRDYLNFGEDGLPPSQ